MAWDICISAEGWQDIYDTLHDPRQTLTDTLVEAIATQRWELDERDGLPSSVCEDRYHETKARLIDVAHEVLADIVYDQISEVNTCENGGNGYYMCYGGWEKLYVEDSREDD